MIYDKLSNLAHYIGLSPALDRTIAYLTRTDLSALPHGRTEIDGDTVYLNHFGYETSEKQADSLFEAHEAYLDLHIVLSGRERMAVTAVEKLSHAEDRLAEDAVMYTGEADYALPLAPGQFALVAPGEGHLPHLVLDVSCAVDKLVCKIHI
ncbi:YhcH/YjgK/YiaL family protein [Butyricicoccus sp. Marseille-Q5471]|uniref:YhcH/YjgK/YiaL family protein n=1 Tax=Butyricicoccus sp. Marseille-Q5471 TaxID=3039493 RepID=UPI0024BCB14D|nr:YhcH/YjgK/YiaL family protein [Butyricicoccus sp. Marseille-Q5471]